MQCQAGVIFIPYICKLTGIQNFQIVEKLLVPVIAVVLLILLFFIFRIRLMLIFTRKVYGKYSSEFIIRFKSLTKTNPYPYCLKAELFQHLCLFRDRKPEYGSYYYQGQIKPAGVELGIPFRIFLNSSKEFDCFNIVELDKNEVLIAGKQSVFYGVEALVRFYFLKGRLFKVDYLYRNITRTTMKKILGEFKNSMSVENDETHDTFYIECDNCSIYAGDDGFSLMIKFLERNNPDIESILRKTNNKDSE